MDQCSFGTPERPHAQSAWVVTSEKAPRCVVVFEHHYPLALREGALRLGLAENEVTCDRVKRYDRFADTGRYGVARILILLAA